MTRQGLLVRYRRLSLPVKAGVWFTICTVMQRAISVLSMPIFTRLLMSEEFGTYTLYTSWYMILTLIVTMNIYAEVFNKGLADYPDDRDRFTASQVGLLTILSMGFLVLYLLLQTFINALTGMSTILTLFAFAQLYLAGIISFWAARERFEFRYKKMVLVLVGSTLMGQVFGVVFVLLAPAGIKVEADVLGIVAGYGVFAVPVAISILRKSKALYVGVWWKGALALSVPLIPHYLSQVLLNQSDKVMIGWFCNATDVGIYGIAHSAGLLLVMVTNGMNQAFVPWLYGKLRKKDYDPIAPAVGPLLVLVLVLNFILVLLAPEAVLVLSTSDYTEAKWCIAPIATGVIFSFIYTMFVNAEIYYGRTGFVTVASVLSAVVNIVLNLIFIPVIGYIAAAYTTAFSYLLTAALHYVFLRVTLKKVSVPFFYDVRFMALCGVLTCGLSALAMVLYWSLPIRLGIIAGGCVAAYVMRRRICVALSVLKKKETEVNVG